MNTILMIFGCLAILLGLLLLVQFLRSKSYDGDANVLEHKNGLPILPRDQRHLPEDKHETPIAHEDSGTDALSSLAQVARQNPTNPAEHPTWQDPTLVKTSPTQMHNMTTAHTPIHDRATPSQSSSFVWQGGQNSFQDVSSPLQEASPSAYATPHQAHAHHCPSMNHGANGSMGQHSPHHDIPTHTQPSFSSQPMSDFGQPQPYPSESSLADKNMQVHATTFPNEPSPSTSWQNSDTGVDIDLHEQPKTMLQDNFYMPPPSERLAEPSHEFRQTSPILSRHLTEQQQFDQNNDPLLNAQDTVTIMISPRNQHVGLSGREVLSIVRNYGFKYGVMNMYHRYEREDGTGDLWFSVLGMNDEGVQPFDLNTLADSYFTGLSLFLSLPHPHALRGFESMISTARLIAKDLNADIHDEEGYLLDDGYIETMRLQVANYQL